MSEEKSKFDELIQREREIKAKIIEKMTLLDDSGTCYIINGNRIESTPEDIMNDIRNLRITFSPKSEPQPHDPSPPIETVDLRFPTEEVKTYLDLLKQVQDELFEYGKIVIKNTSDL